MPPRCKAPPLKTRRNIHPQSPGFRVTLLHYLDAYRLGKFRRYFDTMRVGLGRERLYQLSVSTTAACDSLQIGHAHVLNRDLHLDFQGLRCLKLVEIRKTENWPKNNPKPKACTLLADGHLQLLRSNHSPRN